MSAPVVGCGYLGLPAADKRVGNARLPAELEITLAYASYRKGLREVVAGLE